MGKLSCLHESAAIWRRIIPRHRGGARHAAPARKGSAAQMGKLSCLHESAAIWRRDDAGA